MKKEIKGEIVLLIHPVIIEINYNEEEIKELFKVFSKNDNDKTAIKKISDLIKINKNKIYEIIKKSKE